MMARSLQDQFIDDDEEETCPLCVEELDLTDKGFRPCPCGYQVKISYLKSPGDAEKLNNPYRSASFATTMSRLT